MQPDEANADAVSRNESHAPEAAGRVERYVDWFGLTESNLPAVQAEPVTELADLPMPTLGSLGGLRP